MPSLSRNKKPTRVGVSQDGGWFRWFGFWPRLGLLIFVSIMLIIGAGWLWRGAWPRAQRARLEAAVLTASGRAGFAVKQVTVEGRRHTDKKDLMAALDIKAGEPIFAFSPQAAYAKLIALPWTRAATVLRILPDKIVVRIEEREPFARWQRKDNTVVIDTDGVPLEAARVELFSSLPLIIGDVAPQQAKEFMALLASFPDIARRLKGAVRVSERRWNLHLMPEVTVLLPEKNAAAAMDKLLKMMDDQKIMDLDIKTIDLRLPEKVFIEPTGGTLESNGEKTR